MNLLILAAALWFLLVSFKACLAANEVSGARTHWLVFLFALVEALLLLWLSGYLQRL